MSCTVQVAFVPSAQDGRSITVLLEDSNTPASDLQPEKLKDYLSSMGRPNTGELIWAADIFCWGSPATTRLSMTSRAQSNQAETPQHKHRSHLVEAAGVSGARDDTGLGWRF